MKKCISLALVAMSMLAITACTNKNETNNGVNDFKIHRGTNVSHWLSQSESSTTCAQVTLKTTWQNCMNAIPVRLGNPWTVLRVKFVTIDEWALLHKDDPHI